MKKALPVHLHPFPFLYRSTLGYCLAFLLVQFMSTGCRHPSPPQFKTRVCGFIPLADKPVPSNAADPDLSVKSAVEDILIATGMGMNNSNRNFYLGASDSVSVPQAVVQPKVMHATDIYLHRYILFSKKQLDSLLKFCSPASAYVLFAHEISHHLSGDNLAEESNELSVQRELSADSFAGFLCYRISLSKHFTLKDCLKIYEALADEKDTLGYPNKKRRELIFSQGWAFSMTAVNFSCEAISKTDSTPVPAMLDYYRLNLPLIKSVRTQFANGIVQNEYKLGKGAAQVDVPSKVLINLRGDTVLYVQDEDRTIRPVNGDDSLSTKPLVKTTEKIPLGQTRNLYIIDKANVIWARYPNGIPYIVGYAQAIKN